MESTEIQETQLTKKFLDAVLNGKYELVESMLKEHNTLLLECTDGNGATPFFIAAQEGHEKIAELLHENDANIHAREDCSRQKGFYGRMPIHIAARNGHLNILKLLHEWGADIDATTQYEGKTLNALDIATHSNDIHKKKGGNNKKIITFLKSWKDRKYTFTSGNTKEADAQNKNNRSRTRDIKAAAKSQLEEFMGNLKDFSSGDQYSQEELTLNKDIKKIVNNRATEKTKAKYTLHDFRNNKEKLLSFETAIQARIDNFTEALKIILDNLDILPGENKKEMEEYATFLSKQFISLYSRKKIGASNKSSIFSTCWSIFKSQDSSENITEALLEKKSSYLLKLFIAALGEKFKALGLGNEKFYTNFSEELSNAENLVNWESKSKPHMTIIKPEGQEHTIIQCDIPINTLTSEQKENYWAITDSNENNHPAWFKVLSSWEKSYWRKRIRAFGGAENINLGTAPSTIRKYPGLPFHMRSYLFVYKGGKCKLSSFRVRSSVVVPYGVKPTESNLVGGIEQLTQENIIQLIFSSLEACVIRHLTPFGDKIEEENTKEEETPVKKPKKEKIKIPILIQTLLTKLTLPVDVAAKKAKGKSESDMIKEKSRQIKILSELINDFEHPDIEFVIVDTNYPVNQYRKANTLGQILGASVEEDNNANINKLVECFIDYLKRLKLICDQQNNDRIDKIITQLNLDPVSYKNIAIDHPDITNFRKITFLKELPISPEFVMDSFVHYITEQKNRIDNIPESNKKRVRNLNIAALEKNIVEGIGGLDYSSCMSGKDRNGMLIAYEMANHILFSIKGFVLGTHIGAKDARDDFIKIYTWLFNSDHQQHLAALNSKGCRGLKSVEAVLSKDMISKNDGKDGKISRKKLKRESKLADLNRPKKLKLNGEDEKLIKYFNENLNNGKEKETEVAKKPSVFKRNSSTLYREAEELIDIPPESEREPMKSPTPKSRHNSQSSDE